MEGRWGDMGRDILGDTVRHGGSWGDMWRDISGDMGKMWGDMVRCGETWRDMGRDILGDTVRHGGDINQCVTTCPRIFRLGHRNIPRIGGDCLKFTEFENPNGDGVI